MVRGSSGDSRVEHSSCDTPTQVASPGPVDGNVVQVKYVPPYVADIQGHPLQSDIDLALKNSLIDTYADGTFRPNDGHAGRLARTLVLDTPLRQSLGASAKFGDVSGDLLRVAEAVTSKGSTLRDYDFVPTGMMSSAARRSTPRHPSIGSISPSPWSRHWVTTPRLAGWRTRP